MKPTIGRIVLYHPGDAGEWSPFRSPAIVQAVNGDGTLNLWVFGPHFIQNVPSVREDADGGGDPGTWSWPPRV